jgi:DNA-binding NarL/FixJ family response regulator
MSINNDRPAGIRVCVVVSESYFYESHFPDIFSIPSMKFAGSAQEALAELSKQPYDVLVASIHLGGTPNSGLRLLSKALAMHRGLKGMVIGDSGSSYEVVASFRAGARGFVPGSECSTPELLKAIRCVHDGQVWASSHQLVLVLEEFATHRKAAERVNEFKGVLSARESEIAQLIVRGKSNKEIAAALQVSQHTVKNHMVKIFTKLGVSNRSAAIFRIYQHSILRPASQTLRSDMDEVINL